MARNYEKRYTGLNRFLEAKQIEERGEEGKPRPPLGKLHTADDVKKWIPSIQREIVYLLQQVCRPHESRNYTDAKIEEFKDRIELLKNEHKRFIRKVQSLDPSYEGTIPWQNRGYTRKRSCDPMPKSCDPTKKLHSPLLANEAEAKQAKMATTLTEKAISGLQLVQYSDSESSVED